MNSAKNLYLQAIFRRLTQHASVCMRVCIYLFIILHHYEGKLALFEVQASDFGPEIDNRKSHK